jgi:hypothetical protein
VLGRWAAVEDETLLRGIGHGASEAHGGYYTHPTRRASAQNQERDQKYRQQIFAQSHTFGHRWAAAICRGSRKFRDSRAGTCSPTWLRRTSRLHPIIYGFALFSDPVRCRKPARAENLGWTDENLLGEFIPTSREEPLLSQSRFGSADKADRDRLAFREPLANSPTASRAATRAFSSLGDISILHPRTQRLSKAQRVVRPAMWAELGPQPGTDRAQTGTRRGRGGTDGWSRSAYAERRGKRVWPRNARQWRISVGELGPLGPASVPIRACSPVPGTTPWVFDKFPQVARPSHRRQPPRGAAAVHDSKVERLKRTGREERRGC